MSEPPYTVIGTPFSTFTRSVTLGLQYKHLPYKQIRCLARSEIAYKHHPFGYLPTLVIHELDGKPVDVKLCESLAIVRFIDRIAPQPSLHINSGDGGAVIEEQMWQFMSLAGSHAFPAVEAGVVKPRVAANDEGRLSDAEIRAQIKDGVEELKSLLSKLESLMAPEGFVFGDKVTWADFFLFPPLADLRATPEGEVLSPRFISWMKKMDELDAVKATTEGTLSAGARPP